MVCTKKTNHTAERFKLKQDLSPPGHYAWQTKTWKVYELNWTTQGVKTIISLKYILELAVQRWSDRNPQ